MLPERKGIGPSYEQKQFDPVGRKNQLQLVASRDAAEGSLLIHQDAKIYLADLTTGNDLTYEIPTGRYVWLQVLVGSVIVNGQSLSTSDAVAVSDESALLLHTDDHAEFMLFDLA